MSGSNSASSLGTIPVLDEPPSALEFLRNYVALSRPCIIRNAMLVKDGDTATNLGTTATASTAPELQTTTSSLLVSTSVRPLYLSLDDIVDIDPQLQVQVDVTPDGHGDCIRSVWDHSTQTAERLFVTPEQRRMTLEEFRNELRKNRRQKQQRTAEKQEKHNEEENDDDDDDDDLQFNEEMYDELDGKRIFAFKHSQPSPQKKKKKKSNTNQMEDLLEATCGPMMMTSTTTTTTTTTSTATATGCNPFGEMEDLIKPFFNDLLNDSNNDNDQDATEAEDEKIPPPPPPPPPSVLYYSRQNDCFRTELSSIFEATRHIIPSSLSFAEQAFGTGGPEAINVWMGDELSQSAMHKDPYENLFYVASGEKVFTLCPPSDIPFLYEHDVRSGTFDSDPPSNNNSTNNNNNNNNKKKKKKLRKTHYSKNKNIIPKQKKRRWTVKTGYEVNSSSSSSSSSDSDDDDDILLNNNDYHRHERPTSALANNDLDTICPNPSLLSSGHQEDEEARCCLPPAYVRWIEADVTALTDPFYERRQLQRFPLLKYAHPIHQVRVQAGELLYLPALWFHHVTQSRETIGLNYWYNMNFSNPHWTYFQLLNQMQLMQQQVKPNHESSLQQQQQDQEHYRRSRNNNRNNRNQYNRRSDAVSD